MSRHLLLLLLGASLVTGCGGYASTSEQFRRSMTAGRPEQALAAVDQALDVPRPEDLPAKSGDATLLLLERATILQAMGRNDLSARDFETADKKLEVLDFTSDTAGDIGKWIFSDDSTLYRAPPHEKLLVNTLNMINYLVRGDASGAKIEARRFQVNQKYYQGKVDSGDADTKAAGMLALGSYLAGFAFEMDRDAQEAMRYYGDAASMGGVPGLAETAQRLAARSGATDERLKGLIGDPSAVPAPDPQQAELLVIVQIGMAPFRIAERLPIGAAMVVATAPGPGARLTPDQQRQANVFAAKGLLKFVNYPKLRRSPASRYTTVNVNVDGGLPMNGGVALSVEDRVIDAFQAVEGTILGAAIVRLITRAIAGEATDLAARKASGNGAIGLLAGLLVEGAMTAADTPDTRSWVTLPGRIYVARARVPAGRHTVNVSLGGFLRSNTVDLAPGGWGVLNFSDLR